MGPPGISVYCARFDSSDKLSLRIESAQESRRNVHRTSEKWRMAQLHLVIDGYGGDSDSLGDVESDSRIPDETIRTG